MDTKLLAGLFLLAGAAIAAQSYASQTQSQTPAPVPTPNNPFPWLTNSTNSAAASDSSGVTQPNPTIDFGYSLNDLLGVFGMSTWKTNEYPKYANAIRDAENKWGIPQDLLARLLYQESRYRADVIDGEKRSPVGAIGIAQFMPATAADYGLTDRTDPYASIDAAGHYLHDLYRMFNDWKSALMAYNWGPGNVLKYNRGEAVTVPIETSQYVAQITADVPVA